MGSVSLQSDGRWAITYAVASGVETTLTTPAASREEAERLLHHCEVEAWTCRVTGVPIQQEPLPWRLLWSWWDAECLPRYRSREWRGIVRQLARDYLIPVLGPLCAGEIRPSFIEAIMVRMVEAGKSPSLANKVRSLAKSVIRDAIKNGKWLRVPNPVEFTKPLPVPQKQRTTLTLTEFRRLLRGTTDLRRRAIWALSGYLGLRKGELFALRRSDIDTRQRALKISKSHDAAKTKNGKDRELAITRELWSILGPYLATLPTAPDALLFPASDGGLLRRDHKLGRALRTDLIAAGVIAGWEARCRCGWHTDLASTPTPKPKRSACQCGRLYRVKSIALPIRAHDLRHTFTTLAKRAGAKPEVVQMTLGHSGGITSRYTHLDLEDQRKELSKMKIMDERKGKPKTPKKPPTPPDKPPKSPPPKTRAKKMAVKSANSQRPVEVPESSKTENHSDEKFRSGDPQLGKLMLYQLSYSRDEEINVAENGAPPIAAPDGNQAKNSDGDTRALSINRDDLIESNHPCRQFT
ncbi:MAG: site-specific integrase [Myxococcales bacterium]|nr:site-specific integrase [Myxococcales bacterium]